MQNGSLDWTEKINISQQESPVPAVFYVVAESRLLSKLL